MIEFKKGDRVRIRAEEAEGFLLPFRKFAHEGRAATVTEVHPQRICVLFDVKRKRTAGRSLGVNPRSLEALPEGQP